MDRAAKVVAVERKLEAGPVLSLESALGHQASQLSVITANVVGCLSAFNFLLLQTY